MKRLTQTLCLLLLLAAPVVVTVFTASGAGASPAVAQTRAAAGAPADLVEFDMMTWVEVRRAIHEQGKTTALVYNGGTEQRGPQNVNGGHTLMGREIVKAIALELGNAIAAPVLPFSINAASADLPGTIGLSSAAFAMVNREVTEELIKSGFRNVVLMGDHGGGQKELQEVAATLDRKYAPQGIHVYYCDDVYAKSQKDFITWLEANGYPGGGGHGAVADTSLMLYLEKGRNWVRQDLLATAMGDPAGASPTSTAKLVNNGITGDARRSAAEIGKRRFDLKVDYAVAQIKRLLGGSTTKKP